jgi:hypothetical protein
MTKKKKTASGNDDLTSARSWVKRRLEQALVEREADVAILRQLIPQVRDASPYLIQKFASEAKHRYSRLVTELVSGEFGYFDAEGNVAPSCGNVDSVVRLDAFLSYHLTEETLRRRRDASSDEYEPY